MSSLNKVQLIGNLGRDPEVRTLNDGTRLANLSIATSERWKEKQSGEQREKTEWHRVVIWNEHLVDIAERYLRKGSKVYLEGALQTRKWTDKDGQERYSTEVVLQRFRGAIVMLDKAGSSGSDDWQAPLDEGGRARPAAAGSLDLDDEIPF